MDSKIGISGFREGGGDFQDQHRIKPTFWPPSTEHHQHFIQYQTESWVILRFLFVRNILTNNHQRLNMVEKSMTWTVEQSSFVVGCCLIDSHGTALDPRLAGTSTFFSFWGNQRGKSLRRSTWRDIFLFWCFLTVGNIGGWGVPDCLIFHNKAPKDC